jgi:voltage-gated potassium channel
MTEKRWLRLTEWPLAGVSLIFLAAYSWEVIGNLQGARATVTETIINVTWALFALDYVVRFVLAAAKWRWFRTHLLDLLIVALPIARPLRLLRLVTLLNFLHRSVGGFFRGRVVIYAIAGSSLLVYVAALAELDAERDYGHITNFGDALWWAFVTISTVGYGDYFPVTLTGRLVAVGVMVGGIALLGVVTATLASWIVERVSAAEQLEDSSRRSEMAELIDEVRSLRAAVEADRRGPLAGGETST